MDVENALIDFQNMQKLFQNMQNLNFLALKEHLFGIICLPLHKLQIQIINNEVEIQQKSQSVRHRHCRRAPHHLRTGGLFRN